MPGPVVGAGPTGLVLVAQLLARGIRTRIVDKSARGVIGVRPGRWLAPELGDMPGL
jgi:NADPH-dependent 2,4-dienoyl-CoA reductase/sulfur reductase-like enzyme